MTMLLCEKCHDSPCVCSHVIFSGWPNKGEVITCSLCGFSIPVGDVKTVFDEGDTQYRYHRACFRRFGKAV